MRCCCCNKNLNDYESTLKNVDGDFLDTCNKCIKGLGIVKVGRPDLEENEEMPDDLVDVDDFELEKEDGDWNDSE